MVTLGSSRSHLFAIEIPWISWPFERFLLDLFSDKIHLWMEMAILLGGSFWVVVATIGFNTKLWSSLSLHHITSPCEVDDPRVWCLRGVVPKCIPNKFLGAKLFLELYPHYILIISPLQFQLQSQYSPSYHHYDLHGFDALMLKIPSKPPPPRIKARRACRALLLFCPFWIASMVSAVPLASCQAKRSRSWPRQDEWGKRWSFESSVDWGNDGGKTLIWTDLNMYWEKMW